MDDYKKKYMKYKSKYLNFTGGNYDDNNVSYMNLSTALDTLENPKSVTVLPFFNSSLVNIQNFSKNPIAFGYIFHPGRKDVPYIHGLTVFNVPDGTLAKKQTHAFVLSYPNTDIYQIKTKTLNDKKETLDNEEFNNKIISKYISTEGGNIKLETDLSLTKKTDFFDVMAKLNIQPIPIHSIQERLLESNNGFIVVIDYLISTRIGNMVYYGWVSDKNVHLLVNVSREYTRRLDKIRSENKKSRYNNLVKVKCKDQYDKMINNPKNL